MKAMYGKYIAIIAKWIRWNMLIITTMFWIIRRRIMLIMWLIVALEAGFDFGVWLVANGKLDI